MKSKLSALLIAAYLMVGCSSGGGTSGAGGSGAVTAGEFILSASFVLEDTISMDTIQGVCDVADDGEITFEVFTTQSGTFTITITNNSSTTSDIFPGGIILESYRVEYIPQSSGAPSLTTRSFGASSSVVNATSISTSIIVADLAFTKPEYNAAVPSGDQSTYTVRVTMNGRTVSGDAFAISASAVAEFGNFDNC